MRLQVSSAIPVAIGNPFQLPKWDDFIQRRPDQKGTEEDKVIVLSPPLIKDIYQINQNVNSFPYQEDETDFWDYTPGGDCEDKALCKRNSIHDALGIPLEAMRLTIGRGDMGAHAVLTIRTTDGDYILDNNQVLIVPWFQSALTHFTMWHVGGHNWQRLAAVKGITKGMR